MSACDQKTAEGRDQRGRFKPGNPGKPKGARNRATQAAAKLIDKDCKAITSKAIEMALAGDATALRLCVERIVPPRKDSPVSFDLPRITNASEAAQAAGAIIKATAAGQLTPLEAASIMALVESYRRTLETTEFEQRLNEIEEAMKQ